VDEYNWNTWTTNVMFCGRGKSKLEEIIFKSISSQLWGRVRGSNILRKTLISYRNTTPHHGPEDLCMNLHPPRKNLESLSDLLVLIVLSFFTNCDCRLLSVSLPDRRALFWRKTYCGEEFIIWSHFPNEFRKVKNLIVVPWKCMSRVPVWYCIPHVWNMELLDVGYTFLTAIRFIHKFPDWSPGARTANGTALCYRVQSYRYFVSQSSE
jgi:hypothetical protein